MAPEIHTIFKLLITFQVKHFLADFPLQREYMLKKVRPNWDFVWPLALHCGVHGFLTLIICMVVNPQWVWLAGFDFVVHFIMDRIKAGPRYLGRFHDKDRSPFWVCLGLDQMVHHLTHYFIIWQLVTT